MTLLIIVQILLYKFILCETILSNYLINIDVFSIFLLMLQLIIVKMFTIYVTVSFTEVYTSHGKC